jgi:hypothetical protein
MEPMSFNSFRVRLLLVVWLLLVGAAVAVGVNGEQADLGSKAEDQLSAAGIEADVSVSGRDVTLTGAAADREAAEAAVAGIAGIRVVDWLDRDDGSTTASPATSTTAPVTTTTSDGTLPPITTGPEPGNIATMEARLEGGKLVVRGTIPDEAAAARLEAVAELIYAPLLDNQLEIDSTVETASWVPSAADAIAVLPILGTSGINVAGEQATLFGYAPSRERLAQAEGALAQALGPEVSVSSEVIVTGLAPPTIAADVDGDGILVIDGTVPSQDIVDFAVGLGVDTYGAANVVNNLEVDPGVDTTFSLFRLPLVFGAFQPFPVWHVEIYDNVISGQLLSGASYPSGSAELTPQLLQLLPIGAGILTRNPSLVMTVEGHTDNVGSDESNQRLSEARARAAKEWLIAAGIDESRVFAVGYGESRPIASNDTPEGRAQNRRIEFRLGPPE